MLENQNDNIPILFITFNRLETVQQVFKEIKKIQPKKLYLASDGARSNINDDVEKIRKVRSFLIENITWNCEVKKLFHSENLGCKYGPQNAITWFFENEEMGIILEDDCLPSESFFKYCNNLLHHYKNDLRVFTISGFNFQSNVKRGDSSYFFTKLPVTWGWATWRNRWQLHLNLIADLSSDISNPLLNAAVNDQAAIKAILNNAKMAHNNLIDTWDFLWIYSCLLNNSLTITPNTNLVQNIGYGPDSTHTTVMNKKTLNIKEEFSGPIIHPKIILPHLELDSFIFKEVFNWKSFFEKISSPRHIYNVINNRFLLNK